MKNYNLIIKKFVYLIIILLLNFYLFAEDIYLEIKTDNYFNNRRQFILVDDFVDDINIKELGKLRKNIIKNLGIENIFKVEDSKDINKNLLNNENWVIKNIDYRISFNFDKNLNIFLIKVFYVKNKEKVLDKGYKLIKNISKLSNIITNDIYFLITGDEGLFLTKFVFSYNISGNIKEIYSVDYNGENLTKITNHNSISILPFFHYKDNIILYTSYYLGNPDLFLYNFDTNFTKVISNKQGLNTSASFSKDGKFIALNMTIKGNPEIVLLDKNGNFLENITDNRFIDASPTFSSDSKKIAFISNRTGINQIYIYDILQKKTYPITFDRNYKDSLDWDINKDEIIFSSIINKKFEICKINVNTKKIDILTSNSGNNEDPSWSKDGKYICFVSDRDEKKELFVMNADGSNQRKIFSAKGNVFTPNWSNNIN